HILHDSISTFRNVGKPLLVYFGTLSKFWEYPRDLRNPRSFPTRRSSDLSLTSRTTRNLSSTLVAMVSWRGVSLLAAMASRPLARSEEHTSELQSREKLVCRPLLEQKKKTILESFGKFSKLWEQLQTLNN